MDSRPRKLPLEQGCGRLWAGAASYGLPNRAPKYGLNRWSIRLRGQSINTLTVEPRHDLCFDGESTRKFWLQNRGHSGCRYIYIYPPIPIMEVDGMAPGKTVFLYNQVVNSTSMLVSPSASRIPIPWVLYWFCLTLGTFLLRRPPTIPTIPTTNLHGDPWLRPKCRATALQA